MIRHLPRSLKQVPPSLIPTAVEEIEGEERDIMLLGAPESDVCGGLNRSPLKVLRHGF